MASKDRYQISPFLSWREIEGQAVAVDAQEGKVYQFNQVAAVIWKSLEEKKSVEEIISHVAGEFDSPAETIRKDVNYFLKQLFQDDLIMKVSS